jgi:hypothetical protein
MNLRTHVIHALRAGPRRTNGLLLLVGVVLALVPLAGRAQAGVGDYPSPLYLAGPASTVTGHPLSYQLVGAPSPAPTTSVAAGASTLLVGTYRYVYTTDTGSGETASLGATATVTTANSEQITVSGLPTGPTVRLYRMNVSNPTQCYKLVVSLPSNAQTSYTDTNGSATCTGALKRSEDRFPTVTTGWTELSPSTTAPFIGNSPVVGAPAAPNNRGWIVDATGQVSFPTGPWTFEVQTRSTAPDGVAVLVVAMWKIDAATGNPVGGAVLAPTETVQAPASLITGPNALQNITIQTDVPAFSLEASERLYVQFWRHQTTQYAGTTGPSNRIATMFAWDGVAKITHPGASGYAVEPTPVAPAAGASTVSLALSAVLNDPDPSDSGTVEFRVCTAAAAAGVACGPLVDTGSSQSVAKGATAAWTIAAVLTAGDTYHWQARGRDALGGTSAWTATQSFRVDVAPSVPTLIAPGSAAGTAFAPEASYADPDADAGTLEFRVCSAEAAAGVECSGLVASGSSASLASGANGAWTPATLAAATYHWQARARDALGATSAWSATRSYRVDAAPNTPALLAPAAGAATKSVALEVSYDDPDGDAGALELRVCSTEAEAGAECTGHVRTGWFNSVAQRESVRWAPSLPDGVYHWQARAGDTLGAVSAWSATRAIRIDTTPPGAPTAFAGIVAQDGLTLRWEPPSDADEIGNYVVYVDGKASQTLGGQTREAKLGSFDPDDARRFAVAATDTAGNNGGRTSALVGVPHLVGLTREKARAAVAARGLVLRDQTERAARAARRNEVVVSQTPEVLSLVGTGTAVGVVLSKPAVAEALLRFTQVRASCSPRGKLSARIWLKGRARVSATLLDRRKATVTTWPLRALADGTHRLTLRLPPSVRPGRYRLSIAATVAGRTERLSRPLAAPGCARS